MGSLADREAATMFESWESKKARDQRRALEAKIEDEEQRKRMARFVREELDGGAAAAAKAAKPKQSSGSGGGSGGSGGGAGAVAVAAAAGTGDGQSIPGPLKPSPVAPIAVGSKEEARAALAAADASLIASSPMAAVAENRPLPADVFVPQKFDLYNHLGVLTVPILPAVQEFWSSDRSLHSRLKRCFDRSLNNRDSAAGCHAAAMGFWSRIKQPDVFPRELFTGASVGSTNADGSAAPAPDANTKRSEEQRALAPDKEPETEKEWTEAFSRMRGDDRQASILFRLACSKGYDRACWNLGMMHHLGDVDMGQGLSDAEAKKQNAMSAEQLRVYRQHKEDSEEDLQITGTGLSRADLLEERLNLYERMCHGNFQSAAVFCYLAGEETYVQVLRDRLRDEKDARDRERSAKREREWNAELEKAGRADPEREARQTAKREKRDAAAKKRRAVAEEMRKSLLVRARENFCKSASIRPLGFRETKELKESKMVCKTFPGMIAHQIIRDNRLYRRQMFGEGAAGTAFDHIEEMELWGAESAPQPPPQRAVSTARNASVAAAAQLAAPKPK